MSKYPPFRFPEFHSASRCHCRCPLNVRPLGSAPVSVKEGVGVPVVVTVNVPAVPTVNVVLFVLVMLGATPHFASSA